MADTTTVNPHRVVFEIEGVLEGTITARILCDAPEGAPCRVWCDEGCEQSDTTHDEEHQLVDQGYCVRIEGWFDDDPITLYNGDLHELRSGPIHLHWEGDYYTWSYDDSAQP